MYVCVFRYPGRTEAVGPQELELQGTANGPMSVLGIELKPSVRAGSALTF